MRAWRVFFVIAGLFNILGGLGGLLTIKKSLADQGLPAPHYPFAFHLLFLAVMIFGIGYLIVATDPLRHRGIVVLGLLSKAAGLVMSYVAIDTGQMPASTWWQPLISDLPWAIGFAFFLLRPPSPKPTGDG